MAASLPLGHLFVLQDVVLHLMFGFVTLPFTELNNLNIAVTFSLERLSFHQLWYFIALKQPLGCYKYMQDYWLGL